MFRIKQNRSRTRKLYIFFLLVSGQDAVRLTKHECACVCVCVWSLFFAYAIKKNNNNNYNVFFFFPRNNALANLFRFFDNSCSNGTRQSINWVLLKGSRRGEMLNKCTCITCISLHEPAAFIPLTFRFVQYLHSIFAFLKQNESRTIVNLIHLSVNISTRACGDRITNHN